MSYSSIPVTGQSLGQTRDGIKTNFDLIQSTISQDHVPIADTGAGKHNQTTLIEQATDPSTAANEVKVYSKSSVAKARPFIRFESDGLVKSLIEVVSYGSIVRTGGTIGVGGLNNFNMGLVPVVVGNRIEVTLSNALLDANYLLLFSTIYDGGKTYSFTEDNTNYGVTPRSTTRFDLGLTVGGVRASMQDFPNIAITIIGNIG